MTNYMTLPAIARSFQHKVGNSSQMSNYSKVIKHLNEIQDKAHPNRKAKGWLSVFFIALIVAISIAVAVVST